MIARMFARPGMRPVVRVIENRDEELQCLALRGKYEREFVGRVEIPMNVVWLAAFAGGQIVACAGFAVVPNERKIIVTDLYHDDTRAGLRGLGAVIADVLRSDMRIYATIPLDKPALVKALERRGLRVSGTCMER